jgi:hypothetical protein
MSLHKDKKNGVVRTHIYRPEIEAREKLAQHAEKMNEIERQMETAENCKEYCDLREDYKAELINHYRMAEAINRKYCRSKDFSTGSLKI